MICSSCIVIFVLILSAARGQSARWQSFGPEGGTFIETVIDSNDPDRILAFTSWPAQVYGTDNGGQRWSLLDELSDASIFDVAAFDFSQINATALEGCYWSADSGANWAYSSYPPFPGKTLSTTALCIHPSNKKIVYASGFTSIDRRNFQLVLFKSTDGGATWEYSTPFAETDIQARVYNITISRTDPNQMYICGYRIVYMNPFHLNQGFLFKSSDGGETWSDLSDAVDPNMSEYHQSFRGIAVDPTDATRIYLASPYSNGLFYSTDSGASWDLVEMGVYNPFSLCIDPADPAKLYMGDIDKVHFSTDYGQTWSSIGDPITDRVYHIGVSPSSPANVYVSTFLGLYRSRDGCGTLEAIHHGIYGSRISALALAPSQPTRLFIEHDANEVVSSDNSAETWDACGYFAICGNVCDLLVHPTNPDIVLALEQGG